MAPGHVTSSESAGQSWCGSTSATSLARHGAVIATGACTEELGASVAGSGLGVVRLRGNQPTRHARQRSPSDSELCFRSSDLTNSAAAGRVINVIFVPDSRFQGNCVDNCTITSQCASPTCLPEEPWHQLLACRCPLSCPHCPQSRRQYRRSPPSSLGVRLCDMPPGKRRQYLARQESASCELPWDHLQVRTTLWLLQECRNLRVDT